MSETRASTFDVAEPSTNGRHPPPMPRHYQWVPVPEYDGYEVYCWTNAPQRVLLDLDSGDTARYAVAMGELLTDTRTVVGDETFAGWYDCDGEPLPAAGDPTFLEKVPTELLVCARLALREAVLALPNSIARKRAR